MILIAGHFYYQQMYQQLLKAEHFSIINYARALKAGTLKDEAAFSYVVSHTNIKNFNMDNFRLTPTHLEKFIPYEWDHDYYLIQKTRTVFDAKVFELARFIIGIQISLLLFFALLSFLLARHALKPMQEAIIKLDFFSKDLIHDLNNPLTAMKLNVHLLKKEDPLVSKKALIRIEKSLNEVSELHQNLLLLLEEETFLRRTINIDTLIHETAEVQQSLYPQLTWYFDIRENSVYSNKEALKQVLYNLFSNACKYNKKDGFVRINFNNQKLIIENSGDGIKNPEMVFSRSYKEQQQGFGIGLDIVQRLCDAMEIKVRAETIPDGSRFILEFIH